MADELNPFEIWKVLLHFQHSCAAAGLIRDVFDGINVAEQSGNARELRESAMQILNDRDGAALREWLDLHRADRDGFDLQCAVWTEHCIDQGLFEA